MLIGYSTPLSPKGRANLVPRPPWHYTGSVLVIEYVADPEAVRAVLPPGVQPSSEAPGRCTAHFCDWQATTDRGGEALDPARSQYKEFFVVVDGVLDGQAIGYCPYIYVDQDVSLMRGIIQGLPKMLGSVWITRPSEVPSPAAPLIAPGGTFAGTLAVKDRRLAEATVTLEREASSPVGLASGRPLVGVRYFPELSAGLHDRPAVHELVRFAAADVRVSPVWTGRATLSYFPAPTQELDDLAPRRVLSGSRYAMSFSVADLVKLKDLRG